jgi:hypothetical protein
MVIAAAVEVTRLTPTGSGGERISPSVQMESRDLDCYEENEGLKLKG